MRRADLIRRCAGRLVSTKSGNVAVMAGLLLPVGVILAAFAVDQGALYTDRRDLQALSDIAAITAAQNMDRATEAATLVVGDNRSGGISISEAGSSYDPVGQDTDRIDLIVEKGRYTPKSNIAVAQRFQAGVQPFNAARVSMRKGGDLYFGKSLMETPLISATSIAHVPSEAAFSIGSRLASLNGGVVNEVLNKLLGTSLSLSVMDYEALANVNVSALDFISALATELDLEAGTYDDVLDSNASIGQIASALAGLSGANQTAQLALQAIGANGLNTTIPLRHLIDLGSVGRLGIGEKPQGLTVDTNVMDMLQATAALANGAHQVEVGTGINLPGLLSISAKLAIGEPPQHSPFYAVGESGTIVRTAQTRLFVLAQVGGSSFKASGGLLGLLDVVIPSVEIPLYVEVAYAEARLTGVSCPTGLPDSLTVSIAARPGIAKAVLANEAKQPTYSGTLPITAAKVAEVSIGPLTLVQVLASAYATATNVSEIVKTFNKTEIDNKAVKSVHTQNTIQTLLSSLVQNLNVSTKVLNSNLLDFLLAQILATVRATVASTTAQTLTAILDKVVNETLAAAGVRVGDADIRVHGATCGRSVLVQ